MATLVQREHAQQLIGQQRPGQIPDVAARANTVDEYDGARRIWRSLLLVVQPQRTDFDETVRHCSP